MAGTSQAHDPITGLTVAETESFIVILGELTSEQCKDRLRDDLQTAIEIELATIPIYLYTYYSIKRTPGAAGPWNSVTDVDRYANQAGALIMSVAVEEMLHMSLSSNIYYSLYGSPPELYGKSPSTYPAKLPYHNPISPPGPDGDRKVEIPLGKLSYEQLWHFLQIEYPDKPGNPPTDRNWNSLSQFYGYIHHLMSHLSDDHFKVGAADYQIQPYNYSPNNVDTVYAHQQFDPWKTPSEAGSSARTASYGNESDSHVGKAELLTVASRQQAFNAIQTISNQGEGANYTKWDDPKSNLELSHFFKFLTLQAHFAQYSPDCEGLPEPEDGWPVGLAPPSSVLDPKISAADLTGLTYDFPENPTTAGYAGDDYAVAMSNFCNGLYQYMLIMTETLFKVPDPSQKLFFNQGMHFSMIWMLDKVIKAMRLHTITAGDHQGKVLAPTFENIDLGPRTAAYASLMDLAKAVDTVAKSSFYVGQVDALPSLGVYWGSSS